MGLAEEGLVGFADEGLETFAEETDLADENGEAKLDGELARLDGTLDAGLLGTEGMLLTPLAKLEGLDSRLDGLDTPGTLEAGTPLDGLLG